MDDASLMKIFVSLAFILFIITAPSARVFGEDQKIHLFSYYLQESTTIDTSTLEGQSKARQFFRSRDSGKTYPMDPKLLRLIDKIEDHFQVRQVEVISGYRSQAFNRELKATGHHVAGESYHTRGMAADIHLDEISEEALRDFALGLKEGGVGYYPSLHMVHVDVGPVRTWEEDSPRKEWVGFRNPSVPGTLTVKPDRTFQKKLTSLTIETQGVKIKPVISVEFFDRTAWKEVTSFKVPSTSGIVSLLPYRAILQKLPEGKFRFKASIDDEQVQYSNEFYFKRK